ncbi:5'/3'-nucleotidase SurE [Oceaniglobus ichthyenteri]|uniref:5'/3'-nucleotidase SurE n=1 Tax=Oceaniglobus ichthyenteri TaxID=2136177 RepID=UPI000D34E254|nr:5'/3'-nucleotidase SurE [Oceaniglobus ichthyenteri]
MRILITNDDGINAPGLQVLEEVATEIAGPTGEVWVVAPAFEQSGVAHCVSYTQPMMLAEFGPRRFAVEGAPADCVLAAIYDVMPQRPDLVLSGVNRGNNSAENTMYSGTVGAAIEAALQGLPAIALSQYYGPGNRNLADPFDAARVTGVHTIRTLLEKGEWDNADYRLFYNVNFPPVAGKDVKGLRVSTQGFRPDSFFSTEPHMSPSGRKFLWIKGGPQTNSAPGSDAHDNTAGYTSITPMRADLTAHDRIADLKAAIE